MTTPNITFNPILTTVAAGSFNVQSDGYIQGTALDQPAIRNTLAGGWLASTETLPMWGGVGISEAVGGATNAPISQLGGPITRALSVGGGFVPSSTAGTLTGFSVFDQDHAMVNNPQSPVPMAATYMLVNFYRLGSGARIAVACAPALVNARGVIVSQQVSWDFNQQQLVPYVAAYSANVITASSWSSANGGTFTFTTTSPHGVGVGNYFTITGETPSAYNGDFLAATGTTGSTLVATGVGANPGASTVQGTLVAGGGALPCEVLDVNIGNSLTVAYNTTTGFATWNRSGNCAIILI